MYADNLIPDRGAPGNRSRGPGGRGNERYSRQIDELDYIVPRGGYYFEHDDRDVWKPKRGNQQQGGADYRPQPMRNVDRRPSHYDPPPQHRGEGGYNGALRGRGKDHYDARAPVMSRIGGAPSSRALPPSPSAERPVPQRERERSPVGRAGHDRRRPEEGTPARPRTTIRSQVHYEGKVSTAPAETAPAKADADEEAPRGRHSDARTRPDGPEPDGHGRTSPGQRQVSGRELSGAPGRLAGRITSQVVGFEERLQQREQPMSGYQQRSNDGPRTGNGVFQRLGGAARPQHRPVGGMRADAGGKWGHDLFETVNSEPQDKPNLLRKSLLF